MPASHGLRYDYKSAAFMLIRNALKCINHQKAKRESTWLVLLSLLLSPTRLLYALYELLKVSVNEEPDDLDTWWFGPIVVTGIYDTVGFSF